MTTIETTIMSRMKRSMHRGFPLVDSKTTSNVHLLPNYVHITHDAVVLVSANYDGTEYVSDWPNVEKDG